MDRASHVLQPGSVTGEASIAGTRTSTVRPSPRRVMVERTGSTNTDLREALTGPAGYLDPQAAYEWPHLSSLRAVQQSAGRGRGGRSWITPGSGALTVSYVLQPQAPLDSWAWIPLLAGLAVRDALTELAGPGACPVATKWPNDVLLLPPAAAEIPGWGRARKVAGILAEMIPAAPAIQPSAPAHPRGTVVLGIGINADLAPEELPVPWAGSLRAEGWQVSVEEVFDAVTRHLGQVLAEWDTQAGQVAGALAGRLREACWTLGQEVEALTPAGTVRGIARDLRPGLVLEEPDGAVQIVEAGDVHVRSAETPEAAR